MSDKSQTEINKIINEQATYHNNVAQDVIITTKDKIEITLIKHIKKVESKKSWMTPLGVFISLILIPITTENFKDFIFSAENWKAIIYLGIAGSFIWLVISSFKNWDNRETSIESIIEIIKKSEK